MTQPEEVTVKPELRARLERLHQVAIDARRIREERELQASQDRAYRAWQKRWWRAWRSIGFFARYGIAIDPRRKP